MSYTLDLFSDFFPWSGSWPSYQCVDLSPDTVAVDRAADPPVYTAQVGALAPEGLALTLANANLLPAADGSALDFTTITAASYIYVSETGATGTWAAATSAVTADGATITHEWAAGEIEAGRYRVIADLTSPGGVRRTGWFTFLVLD